MTPPIAYGDTNWGFQVRINRGQIEAQFHIAGDISIQNITSIRPLADSIYKSLFNAPDTFNQVRNELGLLLSVLRITEEQVSKFSPNDSQHPELNDVLEGCHGVLGDLERLKTHYDEVGFQKQTTWERMGWGVEELAEIRAKFSSYIQVLNLLNTNMIRSSQETVLNLLKTYIDDCRNGKREGAAMSCISTGSLDAGAKEAWRSLRKDLQSVEITPELFNIHRQMTLTTIQKHLALNGVEDRPITPSTDAESASQADRAAELPHAEPQIPRDWEPNSRHCYSVNVSEGRESLGGRHPSLNSNKDDLCEQLRHELEQYETVKEREAARQWLFTHVYFPNKDPLTAWKKKGCQELPRAREPSKRTTRGKLSQYSLAGH